MIGNKKGNPKDYSNRNYENETRFISYFHQIDSIKKLHPKKVLEIGVGNKTTYNYLKQSGVDIESCDHSDSLCPDHVSDVRDLPFKNESYDLVVAFEILEHIPWDDLPLALENIHRVSSKNVIISIPHKSINFEFFLKFPLLYILGKKILGLCIRLPFFFCKKKVFDGSHYWEIGYKGNSLKKVRERMSEKFIINKEFRPMLNSYHHFFILEKK